MKRLSVHRNNDRSIRLTESQFNDLMSHLEDCKEIGSELMVLADEIIDEENY